MLDYIICVGDLTVPFVGKDDRNLVDEPLNTIIEVLKGLDAKKEPMAAYVIFKLLIESFGDDVVPMMHMLGILEDVKLSIGTLLFEPIEKRILLRRWLDPQWKRE